VGEPVDRRPQRPTVTPDRYHPGLDELSATERLTRVLYLGVGATALIFGALSLDTFLRQIYTPFPIASVACWLALVGLPAVLGFLSHLAPLPVLRRIALVECGIFLIVLAWWLIRRSEPLSVQGDTPWVLMLSAIPTVTMGVFARPWTARGYAITASVASGLIRAATSNEPQPWLIGLQDALYMLLMMSVLVGLTLTARRSAAQVDREAHIARAAETEQAARDARRAERHTINALVHDSVLSTLLMAGLDRTTPEVVARQARSTLAQLDDLAAHRGGTSVSTHDLARRLRQLCTELAPDAHLTVSQTADRPVPPPVVLALLGAAGEALRNSARSAGVGHPLAVKREITLTCERGRIALSVTDDGVGFDRNALVDGRLGIAQSIVGRMERVAGGAADVASTPGLGTAVTLVWAEPASTAQADADRANENKVKSALDRLPATAPVSGANSHSFSASLGVSVHLARALVVLYIVVHSVLAAANSDRVTLLPLGIFAFLLLSTAAIWVASDGIDPMPLRRTFGVLTLCVVAAIIMCFHIPSGHVPPFAHWHLGAITLLLLVLVVQGRTGLAWCGYAVVALITIVWTIQTGFTLGDGLALVSRHAAMLLAGMLFMVGLRHSNRKLRHLHRGRAERANVEARTGATTSERRLQVARLTTMAGPALRLLASTDPKTDADRAHFLLVEASLRDAIRGRCLYVEPIIGATWAARSRGVEVTLLDDSGDRPPASVELTAKIVADELDRLASGRVTVRLLPPGRREFATIVVESSQSRLLLVSRDGTVQET
jgi:signal transduction histidine kinase